MSLPTPLFPDQEFFNIGEACRIVRLPDYTLRYWESKLRLLRPARRTSGHRRYTKRDLELILRLKDLLEGKQMTLSGARKVLLREMRGDAPAPVEGPRSSSAGASAAAKLLREIRSELKALLAELA